MVAAVSEELSLVHPGSFGDIMHNSSEVGEEVRSPVGRGKGEGLDSGDVEVDFEGVVGGEDF